MTRIDADSFNEETQKKGIVNKSYKIVLALHFDLCHPFSRMTEKL